MSSITLGMSYAYGKGNAQVQLESDAIQTAEITNLTVYIAASYRY
jgi:hypothetical protein